MSPFSKWITEKVSVWLIHHYCGRGIGAVDGYVCDYTEITLFATRWMLGILTMQINRKRMDTVVALTHECSRVSFPQGMCAH